MAVRRCLVHLILLCFLNSVLGASSLSYASSPNVLNLPQPGTLVSTSSPLTPVLLKGLRINPKDPLLFDFLVSKGDIKIEGGAYSQEIERLTKYFLTSLTIPEKELWVNLSPYEKDKVIVPSLGHTEMGRDMLAQDYLLKQLTASLIYPEQDLGRSFWKKVYEQAQARYGRTDVPINTFNKVWVLADTAKVLEKDNTAFVASAHLKVMLEEDYLALSKQIVGADLVSARPLKRANTRSAPTEIIRELVLPAIEKEVNEGAQFAQLRQIFYSFVLAAWYKKALRKAILNQVYANQGKVGGIEHDDPAITEKIYQQYLKAYKKGVFNYIKEEPGVGSSLPRKYFSGGARVSSAHISFESAAMNADVLGSARVDMASVSFVLQAGRADAALTTLDRKPAGVLELADARFMLSDQARARAKSIEMFAEYGVNLAEVRTEALVYLKAPQTADVDGKEFFYALQQEEKTKLDLEFAQKHVGITEIKVLDNKDAKSLPYGYALHRENKILYITHKLAKAIKDSPKEWFNFYVRATIDASFNDANIGRAFANQYALCRFSPQIEKLFFSPTQMPFRVVQYQIGTLLFKPGTDNKEYEKLAERMLGVKTESIPLGYRYLIKKKGKLWVAKDRDGKDKKERSADKIQVSLANQQSIAVNQEAARKMIRAANIMLESAMNKIADYKQLFPNTVEKMHAYIGKMSFAILGSAVNPPTLAHKANILEAFALSGGTMVFNLTRENFRKPSLKTSEPARERLAQKEFPLDGLVPILEAHELFTPWNAEEVMYNAIIELLLNHPAYGEPVQFGYQAGDDHFKIFGTDADGNVIWDNMDDAGPNYKFWAGQHWKIFQGLVKDYIGHTEGTETPEQKLCRENAAKRKFYDPNSQDNEMKARNEVIEAIMRSDSWEDFFPAFRDIKVLVKKDNGEEEEIFYNKIPQLDVFAKLMTTQIHFGEKVKIIYLRTLREQDRITDPLRDQYLKQGKLLMIDVPGFSGPVAATDTRSGLVQTAFGLVNFNSFRAISRTSLEAIYDLGKRASFKKTSHADDVLSLLLRQANIKLPAAAENMLPDDYAWAAKRHRRLLKELQDKIRKEPGLGRAKVESIEGRDVDFTIDLETGKIEHFDPSKIRVTLKDETIVETTYEVENAYKGVQASNVVRRHQTVKDGYMKIAELVDAYINRFNGSHNMPTKGIGNAEVEARVEKKEPALRHLTGTALVKAVIENRSNLEADEIYEYLISRFGKEHYFAEINVVRRDFSPEFRNMPLKVIVTKMRKKYNLTNDPISAYNVFLSQVTVTKSLTLTPQQIDATSIIWKNLLVIRELTHRLKRGEAVDPDAAEIAADSSRGGIKFDTADLKLDIDKQGAGIQMRIDRAQLNMLQSGNFTGLKPNVLRVIPLPSALPIFGFEPSIQEQELAHT